MEVGGGGPRVPDGLAWELLNLEGVETGPMPCYRVWVDQMSKNGHVISTCVWLLFVLEMAIPVSFTWHQGWAWKLKTMWAC